MTEALQWDAPPAPLTAPTTLARALALALLRLDVRAAFGVGGAGIAPVAAALVDVGMPVFHLRHEGGAAFAATEASLAAQAPMLVFASFGPSLTNALTGLFAARAEGARVVLVSALTSTAVRGRFALQETTPQLMPFFTSGALFDFAEAVEAPDQLAAACARLAEGLAGPAGFVAHLALSPTTALAVSDAIAFASPIVSHPSASPVLFEKIAHVLDEQPFWIWTGFGARGAAAEIRALQEATGAPVISTPRGKGVFPEDHPAFVGVTGLGGHDDVIDALRAQRPSHMLVLGSRLSELSSLWREELLPTCALVHVDVDRRVFGRAYPQARTVGIHAEVRGFVRDLLDWVKRAPRPRTTPSLPPPRKLEARAGLVRGGFVVDEVQRVVVEGSDALVLAEPGGAFAWANQRLRLRTPGRYRTTMAWASMGQMSAGVVGAALLRRGKAVALVGDGALLMNNEIHSAVRYGALAVWVVLNNGEYGMVRHGMEQQGMRPTETTLGVVDFATLARAVGARGERITDERELAPALQRALASGEPYVLDVVIDPDDVAPYLGRVQSLIEQGVVAKHLMNRNPT